MRIGFIMKYLVSGIVLWLFSGYVLAGTVVVAGASSGVSSLSKAEIKAVYLGKNKSLNAIDRSASGMRAAFISKVVGKSEGQFKAYWSKKIFSGKGVPPRVVKSDLEVKQAVVGSRNTIGYIDSSQVDSSVKVVYRLQ